MATLWTSNSEITFHLGSHKDLLNAYGASNGLLEIAQEKLELPGIKQDNTNEEGWLVGISPCVLTFDS